jgi:hypothetical protein
MTTMSVMVALMPIASGLEEGSELLQAAAVVLIGGLLTSTLLTLVFVPAMYTIFDDMQAGVVRLWRRVSGSRPTPTSATTTATASSDGHGSWSTDGQASRESDGRSETGDRPIESPADRPATPVHAGSPRQP